MHEKSGTKKIRVPKYLFTNCPIKDCKNPRTARQWCTTHYWRWRNTGDAASRTIFTPNEIIKQKEYAEIVLVNKNYKEIGRSKIDSEDVEKVAKHKWRLDRQGYVVRTDRVAGVKSQLSLAEFIIGKAPVPNVIDHKNRDRSDNRKINLRFATRSGNSANRKSFGSSSYKGVCLYRDGIRWRAQICKQGKLKYLGIYESEKAAALAYDRAARELHGEYANTNFSTQSQLG